jgi:cell division protein FtsL
MTIIRPHKSSSIKYFLYSLFGVLLICGGFYISEYTTLAETRNSINTLKKSIGVLQQENADLKSELYAMIDPARLEAVGVDSGLLKESRPHYVTTR